MKNKKIIILIFLFINIILSVIVLLFNQELLIETLTAFCFSIVSFLYFYPSFKNKKIKKLHSFSVLFRVIICIVCFILIISLLIHSFYNIIHLLPLMVINGIMCACIITEFIDQK